MRCPLSCALLFIAVPTFCSVASVLAEYASADDTAAGVPTFPPSPSPDADKAERIEVTGSHIKRTDVEGVAPVETITAKDIQKKGYSSMGDVVRDIGANSFGSENFTNAQSATPGNADISLRGLGADNTLVLLNGERLPQDAITGTVDINLIPLAAVERIEILKDGASAVYGSDALGGVVNIITRKDFQGTEMNVSQSTPTNYGMAGGKQTKASVVNGINTEKLNVVTTVDYTFNQSVYSADRPWSNNGYSPSGYPGSFSNIPANGQGETFYAPTNCPSGQVVALPGGGGSYCQFKFSNYSEEEPQISQIGVLSEAHYELNSNVTLNARINAVHRSAEAMLAPSPADNGQVVLPGGTYSGFGNVFGNDPSFDPSQPLDVHVRLVPLGDRIQDVTTNSFGTMLGATVQLPHDWQMNISSTFNVVHNDSEGVSGFALGSVVDQDIASGAFNPFSTTNSANSLANASYNPWEKSETILSGMKAQASGDLVQTPAGPIGMAIGTTFDYADYFDHSDDQTLDNNVLGNGGGEGGGHRTSEAVYTEFSIPLVKKKLELQVAGRFDHYSDFGSTVNPKVGILYHPSSNWLLRGSVGTGFRAPLLTELYAGTSYGYPSIIDYKACAQYGGQYCTAQQIPVSSESNPNLKQETSVSYTLGTVFAPTPSFNLGADFYYTVINNQPGIDYDDLSYALSKGVDPTPYGVTVTYNANGSIASIDAPLQNLSKTSELGVDLTGSYTLGRFKAQTEQDQMFFYDTEGFPGAGFRDKLGWNGQPAWRNTSSISYIISSQQEASFTSRSIPHQLTLDRTAYIDPLTTLDLSYTYKTKKIGDFTLALINILDSQPPQDLSNPNTPVNYALYDPNGRQLVLSYRIRI